ARAAAAEKQLQATRRAYLESLDHNVGKYCHLSADPHERHFEGGISADWGRLSRKADIELPPPDALHDGKRLTMYEIAGVRERHVVRGDDGHKFKAEVGDLIFLCYGPANHDRHLPPPWNQERLSSLLYGGHITAPPRIAAKKQWNPIHIKLKH